MIVLESTFRKFRAHHLHLRIVQRGIEPVHRTNRWKHLLPVLRHILPFVLWIITNGVNAQMLNDLGIEDTSIDTADIKALRVDLDAFAFFRDNEYNSEIQNGYTLPGVRLTPHVAYTPIKQINIEAGASMLFFNGANKYPCFAYHDIGTWKGEQYQHGAHAMPWVRLQASFKYLDVVLGNIYGGSNHRLIRPLFNAEQNISADPEMGVQILAHTKHVNIDTWMNWQSYQFELDTHQEAFTVGISSRINYTKQNNKPQLYSPIQLVIQHRGGEQDKSNMGVQTICNASLGIGINQSRESWFNYYDMQLNAIGCYQQAGLLWPFDTGIMAHIGLRGQFFHHFGATLDYTYIPKNFVSLYGNPFYSTLPLKHGETTMLEDGSLKGKYDYSYKAMNNIHLCLDYQYTFAKHYTIGADIETYILKAKQIHNGTTPILASMTREKDIKELNFTFGVYMRVSPSILIKKFKN